MKYVGKKHLAHRHTFLLGVATPWPKLTIALVFISSFSSMELSAQSNIWNVFGQTGRIFRMDFSQPVPTPIQVFQYGPITNEEVIETYEDNNDHIRLTFFNDGQGANAGFIYDSTFQVMPNGSGLISHYSIGEEAICRVPCTKDSVILFHQMRYDSPQRRSSYYSIIDLSLPGNGTALAPLGDVVSKNHLIDTMACEGWTISHENIDKTRWMYTCHLISSTLDSFELRRYEISSHGLSAPVVLDTLVFESDSNLYLEVELSPDNSRLAVCNHQAASSLAPDIIVYDHDLCSGTVSNKQTYSCLDKEVLYIEFSPDNSKLYWVSNRTANEGHLGRIDIPNGLNVVIDSTMGPFGKKIEAAGNGHLYIVKRNNNNIAEISNPNAGSISGIGYVENAITSPFWLWHGLPNEIDGPDDPAALLNFQTLVDSQCGAVQVIPDLCKPVNMFWDFGDGTVSTANSPTHQYSHAGTYVVSLNVVTCDDTLTHTDSVTVMSGCVWPGDANNSGTANNLDVLDIGIAYNSSGVLRPNASLIWQGQPCNDWPSNFPNNTNYKYADCDGNGIVNADDTLAVALNYAQTHPRLHSVDEQAGGNLPQLYFEMPSDSVFSGDTLHIPVYLGDSAKVVNSIYGIAFSLFVDTSIVVSNSIHFDCGNSWMGNQGLNLLCFNHNLGNGQLDCAETRTNQQNISGFGQIGSLAIVMQDDISGEAYLPHSFYLSSGLIHGINVDDQPFDIQETEDSVIVYPLTSASDSDAKFNIYPNPANRELTITMGGMKIDEVALRNSLGQSVFIKYNVQGKLVVNTSKLSDGVYIASLYSGKKIIHRKISIMH